MAQGIIHKTLCRIWKIHDFFFESTIYHTEIWIFRETDYQSLIINIIHHKNAFTIKIRLAWVLLSHELVLNKYLDNFDPTSLFVIKPF